jgi:N-acetylneuraminic acid mutarotase
LTFASTACGDDDDAAGDSSPTAAATIATTESPTALTPDAQDAATGEWQPLAPVAEGPRQENAVVELDGEIYVLGGLDGFRILSSVEVYDPESDSWRDVADLPEEMHHVNAAAVDGKIYVVGFLRGQFRGDGRVFVYDPGADSWSPGTPMPEGTERGASAVAVWDGLIYVAGGLGGGAAVTNFSVYDPAADTWQELPDLPQPRDHVAGGAIDVVVYIAGGREGAIESHANTLFAYDIATQAWTELASLPTSRGGVAGVVLDGKLYVFGGEGNAAEESGVFAEAEAYDPATDTWEVLTPMATPRHGTGAAALDGVIYVPAGATEQALGAVDTNDAFHPP